MKKPRLIQILEGDGLVAAVQWIARDGVPFGYQARLWLLRDFERQFKNAKRLAKRLTKKRGDRRIAKAEALAADPSAPDGERAAAREALKRMRARKS